MLKLRTLRTAAVAVAVISLGACGMFDVSYPDKQAGKTEPAAPDDSGLFISWASLFGSSAKASPTSPQTATGIGVNGYLWRASLDTFAFMPLTSADPFGGVIITDWFALPETPNERFKATITITDQQLRADAIHVAVFRQVRTNGSGWNDAVVNPKTRTDLENVVLTRARELRSSNAAMLKKD